MSVERELQAGVGGQLGAYLAQPCSVNRAQRKAQAAVHVITANRARACQRQVCFHGKHATCIKHL